MSSVAEVDALHRWKSHLKAPGSGASTLQVGLLRDALFPQPALISPAAAVLVSWSLVSVCQRWCPVLNSGTRLWSLCCSFSLFVQISVFYGRWGCRVVCTKGWERRSRFRAYFPWKSYWMSVISGKKAMRKEIPLLSKSTPDKYGWFNFNFLSSSKQQTPTVSFPPVFEGFLLLQ